MARPSKKKPKDSRSKRELVVDAAAKLFVRQGFGSTGMDAIAEEAGVSKATLYSYYEDKSALFGDVMHRMCDELGGVRPEDLPADGPEATLRAVATLAVSRLLDAVDHGLLPRAVAEAREFPEIGRWFWEAGPAKLTTFVADYLAGAKARRVLAVEDPPRAAARFIGLVTGMYLLPMLVGVRSRPSPAEIRRDIDDVISSFLASLGGETGRG
jgi:TetR/AcrR family transcriptional repressor of mexJK operon